MEKDSHLEWEVPYKPGTLKAFGYKSGKKILSETVETTDEPVAIKLVSQKTGIKADRNDIAIITASIVDKKGREVPTAENLIEFDLIGPGKIIGVGNGNPTCLEADKYIESYNLMKPANMKMKPVDDILGLAQTSIPFTVKRGISSPVSWKISIPEGLQAVVYRITATSGSFSDGEEAAIPVLTNRMLVTESMPLPVNVMQQKKFNFEKLVNSRKAGSTLRNYRLTLEYTSNPAWYAVQALPYLMEYPYECAEQIFSRYYANSLATHVANSDPKIKRVFESWKNITLDALKSNLEKNEELKSVLLQESPWVREATSESERKQRIALLFDLNRMASEQNSALKKLQDMQNPNGGWPWFKGMPESRYITQHIVTGLGHLNHLEVVNPDQSKEVKEMLKKAVEYLDETVKIDFEKLKKNDKDYPKNNHLGYEDIQYLYARTYFITGFPVGKGCEEAVGYYKDQSVKYWKTQNNYVLVIKKQRPLLCGR